MRTTIRLDDHLLAEVKRLAASTGRTITAVIEDALRETLARQQTNKRRRLVRVTTVGGRGVQPGVDLDDSRGLIDLMDAGDATG